VIAMVIKIRVVSAMVSDNSRGFASPCIDLHAERKHRDNVPTTQLSRGRLTPSCESRCSHSAATFLSIPNSYLARHWSKQATAVWDEDGQLLVWEPNHEN
jgi:hypothetical protein